MAKAVSVVLEPVSAYAEEGIQELAEQSYALLGSSAMSKKVFPDQVAFNLLTHTTKPERNGFSPLENRVAAEVRRVLAPAAAPLPVDHPRPRLPHLLDHGPRRARTGRRRRRCRGLLQERTTFSGSRPPAKRPAISPVTVAGKDRIYLGPVKKDPALAKGFWIWAVADNLTVGSALNAYGIARALFGDA